MKCRWLTEKSLWVDVIIIIISVVILASFFTGIQVKNLKYTMKPSNQMLD